MLKPITAGELAAALSRVDPSVPVYWWSYSPGPLAAGCIGHDADGRPIVALSDDDEIRGSDGLKIDRKLEFHPRLEQGAVASGGLTGLAAAGSAAAQKPTVGRAVHYYDTDGGGPWAAIITAVSKQLGTESLIVFPPGAPPIPMFQVVHSEAPAPDRWTWPPRV